MLSILFYCQYFCENPTRARAYFNIFSSCCQELFSHPCRKDKSNKVFFIYFCWNAHNNIVFQFDCFKEFKDVNEEQKMRRKQQRQMIETKKWRNLLSAKEQEKNFMLSHYVLIHASQIIIKSISMPRRRRRGRRTVVEEVSVYINSSRGKSKILSVLF